MRRAAAPLLLAFLMVLSAVPTVAGQSGSTVEIDYTLELLDAEASRYRITAELSNLDGNINTLNLDPGSYVAQGYECSDLVVDDTPRQCSGRIEVDIESDTLTYTYEAVLDLPAQNAGHNAVTTADWAVLQASGVGFRFSYSFAAGNAPRFDPELRVELPDGWDVAASFPRTGDRFQLEARFPRPAGVLALGDLDTETVQVAGRDATVVHLGGADSPDVARVIEATTPFLRSTHGDHIGSAPLLVVAPDPFKRGGVAIRDGLAVHADSDEQTVAHEWTHIWQRFEICNTRPGIDCQPNQDGGEEGATVWIKEGGAEFYSGLALYAGGIWSGPRTQTFFDRIDDRYEEGALDEAVYGDAQDPAYTKGALALGRGDGRLRNATDGTVDLATVIRELNADAADEDAEDITVTNPEFQTALEDASDVSWAAFFDAYVEGTDDPGPYTFDPTGTLTLSNLTHAPTPVVAGDNVTFRVDVENTGVASVTRTLRFFLDGRAFANRTVELDAGASTTLSARTRVVEPGSVRVEIGTLSRDVDVEAPADLVLLGVDLDPVRPSAGEPYTVIVQVANRGGVSGSGTVEVAGDRLDLGPRDVTVGPSSTATVTFRNVTHESGSVNATATLRSDDRVRRADAAWTVAPSTVLDLGPIESIPGPGLVLAATALLLGARVWSKR